MGVLTSARVSEVMGDIVKDYERLQFGYEILKKIGRLSEHTHEPLLYDVVLIGLQSLNDLKIDLRIVKAWFYLQAAEISGHGLNLSRDHNNKPLEADKKYQFDIAEMSFEANQKGSFSAGHLKLLKILKIKPPAVVAKVSGIDTYLDDIVGLI